MPERNKRKRHEGRADLAGEHPFGDAGQLVLLCVFLLVWVADSFFFNWTTFLQDGFPSWIQIPLSLFVLAASAYLAMSGLRIVFGEVRKQPEVIRKGVFGIVRHPVYFASILFYLGLILSSLSLLSAAIWIFIVLFYYYISRYEEKLLLQKFGPAYEEYKRKVPMLIPGLKRRRR